jgi:hypothetical protein
MRLSLFILLAMTSGSLVHAGTDTPSKCVQELTDNLKLSTDSTIGCATTCAIMRAESSQRFFDESELREFRACHALNRLTQLDPQDTCLFLGVKSRVWEVSAGEWDFLKACLREKPNLKF